MRKKDLSFEKVLYFCDHFWSLSDLFVFVAKFFGGVCQTTDQRAERTKLGKLTLKNCFINQFWTLRKKKLGFSAKQWGMNLKTVAYLCSWPFSEIFLETKIFVWKISVIERKHRISHGNVFSGLSKAHFKCSVQHFEKNMIKVNFTFYGLFRIVCVFLCSEKKVSQGFQNHKLSVQMKNLGRNLLKRRLFQNIFSFWAEKLGVSAKNYRHGCQNCNLRTLKNFWGKTVFLKLNIIANFFGLRDEKKGLLVKKFSSGLLQQEFALTEKCFEEKRFVFRKSFIFLLSVLEFEWFLCLFLQNALVRCVKPPINMRSEIKWGN